MEKLLLYIYDTDFGPWMALLLAFIVLIYWQGVYRHNFILGGSLLPGPKPWPRVGNLPDLFKYGGRQTISTSTADSTWYVLEEPQSSLLDPN